MTDDVKVDSIYQRTILDAFSRLRYRVYEGTVSTATKAKRRAKNKAARVARRAGR